MTANGATALALGEQDSGAAHVFRWSRNGWRPVSLPPLPERTWRSHEYELTDLDAHAGDAWVVGSYYAGDGDHDGGTTEEMGYLALRLHAGKWLTLTGENLAGPSPTANVVSVFAANDAWMAGYSVQSDETVEEFVYHWNGTRPVLTDDIATFVTDVMAVGRNDAWLVGCDDPDPYAQYFVGVRCHRPILVHRIGGRTTKVALPTAVQHKSLSAVAAFGRNDVWLAMTATRHGRSVGPSYLERWDGTEWRSATAPSPTTGIVDLAPGPNHRLWAVGARYVAHADCR